MIVAWTITASTIAGIVLTVYAVIVTMAAAEFARLWFGVNRAGRRCSREARHLATAGIALILSLAGPVFLGLTPTLFGLPVAGLVWWIVRRVRRDGIVIRSLSRPR